jgi:hypothetical protein
MLAVLLLLLQHLLLCNCNCWSGPCVLTKPYTRTNKWLSTHDQTSMQTLLAKDRLGLSTGVRKMGNCNTHNTFLWMMSHEILCPSKGFTIVNANSAIGPSKAS